MKTVIILDYDKFKKESNALDVDLDSQDFLTYLKSIHSDSSNQTAYAYVTINPKLPHEKDRIIDKLWRDGYIVREVKGENFGINFIADSSQYITLDIMREVYENEINNVVLVSNSNKLSNIAVLLREKNVLVENVFYSSSADYDLAIKSNGFIDLEEFIKDEDDETKRDDNDEEQNNENWFNDETKQDDNIIDDKEIEDKDIEEDDGIDFFDNITKDANEDNKDITDLIEQEIDNMLKNENLNDIEED